LRFFARRGALARNLARRGAPKVVPNFPLIREYLGVTGRKKREKFPTFSQGRTPCSMLVKSVEFMRVNGLQKWCDSVGKLGIYRQKSRWLISPQSFQSPLAPKLLVRLKNQGVAKMVRTSSIFTQSLVQIRCCTAA